ncbi:MAG: Holliday junction resolvase [Thermoplasmata archaeon]|nr:Holliday junction resolvase [Thermoplasmata archaeon]
MGVGASQYERELRSLLEGEREALRHYARYLPPEQRPILERLKQGPFLVVRAAGSHGFDLVAMRAGFAFPIEAKASADDVIRFSSDSGRMTDQLDEHLEAANRGGLVVLYAYRRLGGRRAEPWRLFTPQTDNRTHGRVALLRNHVPQIERTREGNGVLRWKNGLPLSTFLDRLFTLFDPDVGA